MPSAEQLAEQRARDLECDRQLEMLRQRARAFQRIELGPGDVGDVGDSDGELALAAAVTALSVRAERAPAEHAASAAELWAALAPRLPPHEPLSAAPQLPPAVGAVARALAAARGAWPDDELQCAAALLSVAVLARGSRCRRAAARALHDLLDDHAEPNQVSALADMLLAALPAARTRLLLSDALRSGAGAGADQAAAALTGAAALQLLAAAASSARARYSCAQLAGRLLAAPGGEAAARARLLAHVALPPAAAAAHDERSPDTLKALLAVSRLKLLFDAKNGVGSRDRPQPDICK